MKVRNLLCCALLGYACGTAAASLAQDSVSYPAQESAAEQRKKFEAARQPHIEEAKKTYPEAKKRFLAGLAPKERFLITVELRDGKGLSEQAYIEVKEIKDGIIKGTIASDLNVITKLKRGDKHSLGESELMDWIISKPDGTEEGNFVGKFLNEYQPNPRSY